MWKNGFVADRVRRSAVQLVPMPRELDRSGALRVDAPELERAAARQDRTVRAAPLEAGFDEFEYGFIYRRLPRA